MKTVLGIFARDIRALVRNPIALIVMIALLVLPGLYAWYCIIANWDPYSNTGNMPIAVVNNDKGATSDLAGNVNIGEQVTEKLHENDSISWRFYDNEEDALRDTKMLECYATIVFPEDLSQNIVGILDGSDTPPAIRYYPNEKQNAVATKVCDAAAQTLVLQINQQFSSRVNETLLTTAQGVEDKLEDRADEANASALSHLRVAQQQVEKANQSLDDAMLTIDSWQQTLAGMRETLAATSLQLPTIRTALDQSSMNLSALSANSSAFESQFTAVLLDSTGLISSLSTTASSDVNQINANIGGVLGSLNEVIRSLEAMLPVADSVDNSGKLGGRIRELLESLRTANTRLEEASNRANGVVQNMNANVQARTGDYNAAIASFTGQVSPQLDAGLMGFSSSLGTFSGAIGQFEPQITGLQDILTQTSGALDQARNAMLQAQTLLSNVSNHLNGTITDLGSIGKALQIDELTTLLNIEPDRLGQFISSPVQLVTEKIYPVSNYGSAVAPFYTNLALWVGCFILISLIKVEVNQTGFEDATPTQRYFGRWLLFVVLSLFQSQVICGVDILLGIDCAHPAAFMASGAVCSFIYMNLIFALVSTFRNIGKTLCILLLIMQVPGSSGMYPIQIMPDFFQLMHPALPFTYGIDAMREALCGMYGSRYVIDLLILFAMLPISLFIGLAVRPFMMNLLLLFDDEMRKTGFFASEEHAKALDNVRLRSLMRAVASHEDYRDSIEERAWRFNRRYPRLRKIGSIATIVIPFAFLLLMLPFNLALGDTMTTDVKLKALMGMLFLLFIVLFLLVLLEFIHRRIAEETRLIGADIMGSMLSELNDGAPQQTLGATANGSEVAAPPLADEVMAMIPATVGTAAGKAGAPQQDVEANENRVGATREIFTTDMRLGFQSAIGVVVIMLLVITPAMYAWFNTAGSWDPYSNTGNLKVGVANSDEGYKGELLPVTIKVGDTIVSQLRGNKGFDWEFVDEDEAIARATSGEYYASIVIPRNFSANMMTYLVNDAEYPNVVYYTNEKENPIAPIITQKGADSIQEAIRATFTQRIDEVGLSLAKDLLEYLKNPRVGDYAQKMSGHLDQALNDLGLGSSELHALSTLCSTTVGVVNMTSTSLEGIRAAVNSAKSALIVAEASGHDALNAFDLASATMENLVAGENLDIDKIVGAVELALSVLEVGTEEVPGMLRAAHTEVQGVCDVISDVLADMDPSDPDYQKVANLLTSTSDLSTTLDRAATDSESIPGDVAASRNEVAQLAADGQTGVTELRAFYQNALKPSATDLRASIDTASASTHAVLAGLENTVNGLSGSTSGLSGQLSSLASGLTNIATQLEDAANRIGTAKTQVSEALASGDLDRLENVLLGSDAELLAKRLASPVEEIREPMYHVANFGSSMASFYTVLSLWVGALVMVSTMRVHVVEERLEELRRRYRLRPRHEFFGRYGIFGFVSLLQSLLVSLGDLMLLHIQCVHPVHFVLCCVFIGQVFCLFVYTMSELFGDIGKALCVILLIMQVAASGGTFPVEMLDPMLSGLVPYLPFFHGMSLLQECVAGMYAPSALLFVGNLAVVVLVLLLIGVVVRKPFRKMNDWFEAQMEKTGYM